MHDEFADRTKGTVAFCCVIISFLLNADVRTDLVSPKGGSCVKSPSTLPPSPISAISGAVLWYRGGEKAKAKVDRSRLR